MVNVNKAMHNGIFTSHAHEDNGDKSATDLAGMSGMRTTLHHQTACTSTTTGSNIQISYSSLSSTLGLIWNYFQISYINRGGGEQTLLLLC